MSENNVSNIFRIFLGGLLGLCCALFPVSVSAAYTWDDAHTDLRALKRDVDRHYNDMVRRSRGVTVSQNGNIVGEVGSGNTMKASTPVRYSSPKLSANSSSILRYGADTVKRGAAACLRAPVRCNLVGLGVGVGIDALLNSIDAVIDGDNVKAPVTSDTSAVDLGLLDREDFFESSFREVFYPEASNPAGVAWTSQYSSTGGLPSGAPSNAYLVEVWKRADSNRVYYEYCPRSSTQSLVGYKRSNRQCQYGSGEQFVPTYNVPDSAIDSLSEDFQLTDSDLPTVGTVVMSFEPTTIELAPTQPEKITDWSHFNNDGTYSELDLSAYFGVGDSPSASPSVEYVEETTKKDFDELGNLVNEETTVERDSAVPNANQPSSPAVELDIPTGCDLFDPFCKWAEWTQQDLDEEDPDFSDYITEFEPEEDSYTVDLGAAVCPAPLAVNIGFLGQDLELSYEPACDLMSMIRPLILASAYLLAAYIYLGVLRG